MEKYGTLLKSFAPEGIVFVPVTASRLRQRGYNQAELLAEAVGEGLSVPVLDLLEKTKNTRAQKDLSAAERRKNLAGSIRIKAGAGPSGAPFPRRVLLIDDVLTTGSTLAVCAGVLKEAGTEHIFILTVASV